MPKTAICTPCGLFEFIWMLYGLKNAGQTFQRMKDNALGDLDFCFVYMDDLLVASKDEVEDVAHLWVIFQWLREAGLVLNVEKCQFGVSSVEYLGHHVAAAGVWPLPSSVAAVKNFPQLVSTKQLMSFLGMLNFYWRFIPGAARMLKPLTDALKGKPQKELMWTEEMKASFSRSKEALCHMATLAHPDPAARVFLAVDASDTHVGAVLQQQAHRDGPQPLGFFSKKLDPAQKNYSAFDRELLVCYLGVRHFRHQLEGRSFYIETDHKPLTFALHRVSEPWSAHQTRQLSYLAEFTSDLRHVPGVQNVVADMLSQPPASPAELCRISSSSTSSASAPPSQDPQSSVSTVTLQSWHVPRKCAWMCRRYWTAIH